MNGIPFVDFQAQRERLGDRIDAAMARVLDHGRFILGPEVGKFEEEFAAFTGAEHVIGCGNGTDALAMVHLAEEIGPGDAVLVPSFTFAATVEPALMLGATPVFVDIDPHSFVLEPSGLEKAFDLARSKGLKPRLVIGVDLFGVPAEYNAIMTFAEAHDLVVVADAAQSTGAVRNSVRVGTMAHYTCTSFFPTKPLACFGDGGAVLTDRADADAVLRSIRVHGKGSNKYENVRIGMNSRLDTLQAAVLREKLKILPEELEARQAAAERYSDLLGDIVETPQLPNSVQSAWAQYTIMTDRREAIQAELASQGIPTMVYYPTPMHRQPAYAHGLIPEAGLPATERAVRRVLSLPMHPYLDEATQSRITEAIRRAVSG